MTSVPAPPPARAPAPAPPPVRVLLADAHPLVREGLRTLLADEPDLPVVGEAADGAAAVALVRRRRPDVVLMELSLPKLDGVAVIRRLRAAGLPGRVLVLTSVADGRRVREAVAAGAAGYLLKDVLWADLRGAIRTVAGGGTVFHPLVHRFLALPPRPAPGAALLARLTPRERAVLDQLARGRGECEIAATLSLPSGVVRRDVDRLLGKLGVGDRLEATLVAHELRLTSSL